MTWLVRKLSLVDNPHGYHVEFDPQSGVKGMKENDTFRCQHCGGQKVFYPDTVRVKCKRCMGDIGECCAHRGVCGPHNPNFEESMRLEEEAYARANFRRDFDFIR